MANNTITAPKGFTCGSAVAGLKKTGIRDIGVLVADCPCTAAATFTTNRFCGAPIVVGREHIRGGRLQAVVVNSGVSNVATGERGVRDAREMCERLGNAIDVDARHVLPSSTGVIGRFLPMDKIRNGIDAALAARSASARAGAAFARAIMTTDTRMKQACVRFSMGRGRVTLAGCAKGSGMIAPNMATMLAFLTTDAEVSAPVLRRVLREAVEQTFNRVSVDECQSTSDTVAILASGLAGGSAAYTIGSRAAKSFAAALRDVSDSLARQIAADGEGATRVIEVFTRRARSAKDAHRVARAVAASPLVKTAVNGGDPNWGRIVQALGTTDAAFDPQRVQVKIGPHIVFRRGRPVDGILAPLQRYMKGKEVMIAIDLAAGDREDRVLTCDFSREYVAINADYTT
ncbi:MAG: bifunctional glutamate N-acetyltransferase/amino-acid acetyltransferase ArgJ [Phycisphaerae bacterium]|nr:bifunctional glutamate N-acetyltransferase/amino-acid acetyltransferase ArgJ [Phycisphaerae bacterium]